MGGFLRNELCICAAVNHQKYYLVVGWQRTFNSIDPSVPACERGRPAPSFGISCEDLDRVIYTSRDPALMSGKV